MVDEVEKQFVNSFVKFLKTKFTTLSAERAESVEVAVQCLQAAYDLDEQAQAAGSSTSTTDDTSKDVDLFEMFQSLYVERNPESLKIAENIKNEGNRLMKEGKYNEALLYYNRAINFDPKNPIFYCNRAAAYIRLNDNERAVIDCKSAISYNPNYGKAYGRLGIAYSNLGKYDEAQNAYAKAIELEPDNQDYRNNLEVARNARNQSSLNAIPHLSEGLNAMLSNPAIRNLFSTTEIDLEQLQNLSQNPMVLNMISQMFAGLQPGGGGGAGGNSAGAGPGPMPQDMLQLFQSFASQLSNISGNPNDPQQPPTNNQQPPPSI